MIEWKGKRAWVTDEMRWESRDKTFQKVLNTMLPAYVISPHPNPKLVIMQTAVDELEGAKILKKTPSLPSEKGVVY